MCFVFVCCSNLFSRAVLSNLFVLFLRVVVLIGFFIVLFFSSFFLSFFNFVVVEGWGFFFFKQIFYGCLFCVVVLIINSV